MRATRLRAVLIAIFILFLLGFGKNEAQTVRYRILSSGVVMATAYNSLEGQTDSTPWITASGTRCREGVIASNFLPLGTKVMIEGFGNQVFTVEDRMNKRYYKKIDIWFRHYNDARKFGIKKIKYHVVKMV